MYENHSPYVQAEIAYRRDRLRSAGGGRRLRHHRFPRLGRGRPADAGR